MQDRRENDKIILDRLDKIQETQTKLEVNLALNTQSTAAIEKHLGTLNGKVAAHNASIQEMQAKETVAALSLAELKAEKMEEKKEKEKQSEKKSEKWSKAWWLVIGIGLTLGGKALDNALQSDVLKEIFK